MADKQKEYTPTEKMAYFAKRVNDKNLTEKQRQYAAEKVAELAGGSKKSAPETTTVTVTDGGQKKDGILIGVRVARSKNNKPYVKAFIDKNGATTDPNG